MNLSILKVLGDVEQRTITIAQSVIVAVRTAYGHLPGDQQHNKAVLILRDALPKLAKWLAHAVVAATFGWIERNQPDLLKPFAGISPAPKAPERPLDEAEDGLVGHPFRDSPFAPAGLGEPLPPESPAVESQSSRSTPIPPLRPSAPVSSGEF